MMDTPAKPFSLSVKAVILDRDGRCLLLKRSSSSRAHVGRWDFPGGKLDHGEDFEAALLREVEEETGLRVRVTRVLGAAESENPAARVAYLLLEARAEPGEVRLSEEHEDHTWVARPNLPRTDLCPQFRRFAREYAGESPENG